MKTTRPKLPIKHVIFDFGNVIAGSSRTFIRNSANTLGVEKDKFMTSYSKLIHQLRTGRVEVKGFWERVCNDLSVEVPENYQELFTKNWKDEVTEYQEVVELRRFLVKAEVIRLVGDPD